MIGNKVRAKFQDTYTTGYVTDVIGEAVYILTWDGLTIVVHASQVEVLPEVVYSPKVH